MSMRIKKFLLGLATIGIMCSTTASATGYQVGGNYHGHGGHGHHYGHGGGYYDRGGFYYGGGWGGPNVIINVPAEGYYAPPLCENVEVCDNYRGVCWLERRCG